MQDSVGDIMKSYEKKFRRVLDPKDYVLIRIDGKAFHSYTRNLKKPYDRALCEAMDETAKALCEQIQGARLGYVESDEISILITAWDNDTDPKKQSQLWMGGVEAKITSISAAIATATFNPIREAQSYDIHESTWGHVEEIHPHPALFDSRVWSFPGTPEGKDLVHQYFEWRRQDSIRNSVTMAASAHFSHKQLHGVNSEAKRDMLREVDSPWEKLPEGFKYGRLIVKEKVEDVVGYVHKRTQKYHEVGVTRSIWRVRAASLPGQDRNIVPNPTKES